MPESFAEYSDEELVAMVRESDMAAFREIYSRYYSALCRYVWYRLAPADMVEDLVQELFVRLWNHRKKLKVRHSFRSYIYRTGHNLVVDYFRKKKPVYTVANPDTFSGGPAFHETAAAERIDLIRAMSGLSDKLKTAVILYYFEGLTYREIAETCGVTVKAVEKRLHSAVRHLRRGMRSGSRAGRSLAEKPAEQPERNADDHDGAAARQ